MVNRNLAGRCGLYCGICEIYRAYEDSRELQVELAKKHDCSPAEVRCEGCQALDVYGWSKEREWGKKCKIVKCLNGRELDFCYECDVYDICQRHVDFARICAGLGIDLRENLKIIQEDGIGKWLMEQDKKWRCPECNRPIIVSYDFTDCHWCGARLREPEK